MANDAALLVYRGNKGPARLEWKKSRLGGTDAACSGRQANCCDLAMSRTARRLIAALVWAASLGWTQTSVSGPKFEVASIKPCKAGIAEGRGNGAEATSPGRLRLGCMTVRGLVHVAYVLFADGHVNPPWGGSVPVSGGPAWIDTDRYQLDAKAADAQSQG